MVRTLRYKYNLYLYQGEELYDLEADPDELINLSKNPRYRQVKKRLVNILREWVDKTHDPFLSQHPTNPAGEPLIKMSKVNK